MYRSLPLRGWIRFWYNCFLFLLGGVLYGSIELLWRGHTHITMPILGGLCFLLLSLLRRVRLPLLLRCLLGALTVTAAEYLCGLLVNCALGWRVWDYSKESYSLHGQICLRYSLYWLGLSLPAFGLAALCDHLCLCRLLLPRLAHAQEKTPDFTI